MTLNTLSTEAAKHLFAATYTRHTAFKINDALTIIDHYTNVTHLTVKYSS